MKFSLGFLDTDLHNVIKKGNILKDIHKRYIMYQVLYHYAPYKSCFVLVET